MKWITFTTHQLKLLHLYIGINTPACIVRTNLKNKNWTNKTTLNPTKLILRDYLIWYGIVLIARLIVFVLICVLCDSRSWWGRPQWSVSNRRLFQCSTFLLFSMIPCTQIHLHSYTIHTCTVERSIHSPTKFVSNQRRRVKKQKTARAERKKRVKKAKTPPKRRVKRVVKRKQKVKRMAKRRRVKTMGR